MNADGIKDFVLTLINQNKTKYRSYTLSNRGNIAPAALRGVEPPAINPIAMMG